MKSYEDWKSLKIIEDPQNPFSTLYSYNDGSMFYIEPNFYTQLRGFKDQHPSCIVDILNEMERLVKKNKKVVFTGDFEQPLTHVDGFIYLEIFDITDKLEIFVEDKSRGSDYGD